MSFDWGWPDASDETWDRCRQRAQDLFQADGTLSHEAVADRLGWFLRDRLNEQPAGPLRDALLSAVGAHVRVATYLSSGQKPTRLSLATMLRLALPFASHPDYDPSWRPA